MFPSMQLAKFIKHLFGYFRDEEEEKIAVLYIQMQLYQSQTLASWIDDKQRDIDTQTNLELFSQIGITHI